MRLAILFLSSIFFLIRVNRWPSSCCCYMRHHTSSYGKLLLSTFSFETEIFHLKSLLLFYFWSCIQSKSLFLHILEKTRLIKNLLWRTSVDLWCLTAILFPWNFHSLDIWSIHWTWLYHNSFSKWNQFTFFRVYILSFL